MIQHEPYPLLPRMPNGLVAANPGETLEKGALQMGFSQALQLLGAALKWRPTLITTTILSFLLEKNFL